jgi:hypothetical protein
MDVARRWDGDGGSAWWRLMEEAALLDGGGPDGARQLQGGKGTIRLSRSEERGAWRGCSP